METQCLGGPRNAVPSALLITAVALSVTAGEQRRAGAPGPAAGESSTQEHVRLAEAPLRIDLPSAPPRGQEATSGRAAGVPLRIGLHRSVPTAHRGNLLPRMTWAALENGALAAALLVSSPQAQSIRVGLYVDLPPGGALRFFHPDGNEHNALVDPVVTAEELRSLGGRAARDAESAQEPEMFWSPSVAGDTIGIEITVPSPALPQGASLRLGKVAHRFAGANGHPVP